MIIRIKNQKQETIVFETYSAEKVQKSLNCGLFSKIQCRGCDTFMNGCPEKKLSINEFKLEFPGPIEL